MTTWTWEIKKMETAPTEGSYSDVVKKVHWALRGVNSNGISHNARGIAKLASPSGEFTDYASLDEATVITWVEGYLGSSKITDIKSIIDAKISEKETPSIVTKPLPWA